MGRASCILHVHNTRRLGGDLVHDLARCFPEFQHSALCVNNVGGDEDWIRSVCDDLRPLHASRLTPELLDDLDPGTVVLHDTLSKNLGTGDRGKDWPYAWLGRDRCVISLHSRLNPVIPADLDVFTSKRVYDAYAVTSSGMKACGILEGMDHETLKADLYPCFMQAVLSLG